MFDTPAYQLYHPRVMGQRLHRRFLLFFSGFVLVGVVIHICGCKKEAIVIKPPITRPRVASLVPAATDLIIGMGASDHLVARSSFDIDRPGTQGLPKVGAYQDLDWEKIAEVQPDILLVFMAPDRMPEVLRQRATQKNIRLINVRMERLEDVFSELVKLGELLGETKKAAATADTLRDRLASTKLRVANAPKVRTLIAREQGIDAVVGTENFINDALEIAGGMNVVRTVGWPNIDREKLISLEPQVIFHLLPEASQQVEHDARHLWASLPQIPAVANQRVYILKEWWVQQPGTHVPDLAERFAELLHPHPPETASPSEIRP
jgi:iron complex transport system substrate-binding protein